MAGQILTLKNKGLHTYPNELSEVPEGALVRADNVVIDAESVIKSRRGFKQFGSPFGTSTDRANSLMTYKGRILNNYSNKLAYDSTGAGVFSEYSGTYSPPALNKMRGIEVNSNFLFTTSQGVRKIDSLTATPINAGAPKALELDGVLNVASGGFLDNNNKVAYIVIWGKKDANENLIIGSPSPRLDISNTSGGSKDVDLEFSIPAGIDTTWFFQVYRTKQGTTLPRTDYYLVYEANPSSAQITAKKVTFTDTLPESLNKGVAAYVSSVREGIQGSNERPPYAEDICLFQNMVFYGNIKRRHQRTFSIIAVGGSNGIAHGDQITINGIIYQADNTVEYIPTSPSDTNVAKFLMSASSSPGEKIEQTAKSLVRVINRNPVNSGVYAYYMSGVNDLPGQILVEAREYSAPAFTIQANFRGSTAYNPSIATALSSINEEKKNGIAWSKLQEPEAVPLSNFQQVGAADKAILRIIPVRDSLFILKEDGVFKLTADNPSNVSIIPFDYTVRLLCPDSAVSLNNQVFMYSDQGVVTLSDSGTAVISRPIEGELLEISSSNSTFFRSVSHAVGYETERKYIFYTLGLSSDTQPTRAYVYNTFTNSWTVWTGGKSSAIVNPVDDKLYMGDINSNQLRVERKNFDNRDYADEEYAITIVSWDSVNRILEVASTSNIVEEMYIVQADFESKVVEVIDSTHIRIEDLGDYTAGAATVYNLIECNVQWSPIHANNPAILKQFREAHILMGATRFDKCFIGFTTDNSISLVEVEKVGQPFARWGRFQWSNNPWGGRKGRKPIRTLVPFTKQRCRWINLSFRHRSAFEVFEINGVSLFFSSMSERSSM